MKEVSTRETLSDAGIVAGLLLAVLWAGVTLGIEPDPVAAIAGVVLTVVLEWAAGRRAESVRQAWRSPAVKGLAVAGCLALGWIALRRVPAVAASLAAGALVTYLLLLALVRTGWIPTPDRWPPS